MVALLNADKMCFLRGELGIASQENGRRRRGPQRAVSNRHLFNIRVVCSLSNGNISKLCKNLLAEGVLRKNGTVRTPTELSLHYNICFTDLN